MGPVFDLKVMVVYYEACGDSRVEQVIKRALTALDGHIDSFTLFGWGQSRWFECFIPIYWLYGRTNEQWLIDLAVKLRCQGFDWLEFFKTWPYKNPEKRGRWSQMSHVVNNAMAIKSGYLLWRLTGDKKDVDAAGHMSEMLDTYHGMVTGVFTGDECLAGTSPVQGTELCAVAEYMYSLETMIKTSGDLGLCDRLEKIAYNALPATFSPNMWSHQYDQQVNQVECSVQEEPVFNTNSGDANIFGLEPNYGCCTANLSQAWPKFCNSIFLKSSRGIAVSGYAPCAVFTNIEEAGVEVRIDSEYPFREHAAIFVKTNKPISFTLSLRIPGWCEEACIVTDSGRASAQAGSVYDITRSWEGETEVRIYLPMKTKVIDRKNGMCALQRGPLVYSLPIDEKWVRINREVQGREEPHCDYEVLPVSPWNYGLSICDDMQLEIGERCLGSLPFSPQGAPVEMYARGRKVDWGMQNGAATAVPAMKWISDDEEELRLIPYGCTNLRITEFPTLKGR